MSQLKENILFAGRYELLRMLGCGASSEVWLAVDMRADVSVALKIYAPGMGLDEDGMQLFRKEFALVFNMNHPNLLRPWHYDVEDRMPYLVMSYCEKGSTKQLIGKMTEQEAWRFLRDVASGLDYLHNKELVHQDVKPDNILIDENNSFLITDFGISTKIQATMHKNPSAGFAGGTIAYTAPERFSRSNRPVKASDIWSLGASVYELLEGSPPFGYDLGGNLQKSGAEIPELEGEWSDDLKKIVELCLAQNTWERPTASDLAGWTDNRPKPNLLRGTIKKPFAGETPSVGKTPPAGETLPAGEAPSVGGTPGVNKTQTPAGKKAIGKALRYGIPVAILSLAAFGVYIVASREKTLPVVEPVVTPADPVIPEDTATLVPDMIPRQEAKTTEEPEPAAQPNRGKTADDYLAEANARFNNGDYEAAIESYTQCVELSNGVHPGAEARIRNAQLCLPVKQNADSLFALQNYQEAKAGYEKIRSINSMDKYAKAQIEKCETLLSQ
jgi:tetratricopeptide (TPR) repeat protein